MKSRIAVGFPGVVLGLALVATYWIPEVPAANSDRMTVAPVQSQCGYQPGIEVTEAQGRCIAETIGMDAGIGSWEVKDEFNEVFAESVWRFENRLIETAEGCCSLGMAIEISKLDGKILGYNTVQTVCMHDEVRCEPYRRPMKTED